MKMRAMMKISLQDKKNRKRRRKKKKKMRKMVLADIKRLRMVKRVFLQGQRLITKELLLQTKNLKMMEKRVITSKEITNSRTDMKYILYCY